MDRLTEEQVRRIEEIMASGKLSFCKLAALCGMGVTNLKRLMQPGARGWPQTIRAASRGIRVAEKSLGMGNIGNNGQ